MGSFFCVDPLVAITLGFGTLDATGTFVAQVALPSDPALQGRCVTVQGAAQPGAAGAIQLTNPAVQVLE